MPMQLLTLYKLGRIMWILQFLCVFMLIIVGDVFAIENNDSIESSSSAPDGTVVWIAWILHVLALLLYVLVAFSIVIDNNPFYPTPIFMMLCSVFFLFVSSVLQCSRVNPTDLILPFHSEEKVTSCQLMWASTLLMYAQFTVMCYGAPIVRPLLATDAEVCAILLNPAMRCDAM